MHWTDPEGVAPLFFEFGYLNAAGQPQILQPRTATQATAAGLTLPAGNVTLYAAVSDANAAATRVLMPVLVTGEWTLGHNVLTDSFGAAPPAVPVECLVLDVGSTSLSQSVSSQSLGSTLSLVSQLSSALNASPLSSSQQHNNLNCSQATNGTSAQQLRTDERSQLLQSVATIVGQASASTPLSTDTAAQVSQTLAQLSGQPTEMDSATVNLTMSLLQATDRKSTRLNSSHT